ncbi:hypothetical protein N1851_033871 [Merluccius polli]|uniref:Uncharacterized protein n=1 Tax=Merluccius polli TaxID=89951 RepID=A0AA47M0U8_MERPO|nr:hypothetical protein N1851_033871 [Merluccius polli]
MAYQLSPPAQPLPFLTPPPYQPLLQLLVPSGPPSMTSAASEQQLAVDECHVPGMDQVDSLAELVGLRNNSSNQHSLHTTSSEWHMLRATRCWPDCCCLESIFVNLYDIYKSPKKQGNYTLTRWTLILRDYSKIRHLFHVNQTTLIHWHNKRLKRQECSNLLQGINLPASIPVAPAPLPPVQVCSTAAPPQPGPQHQYHLTAGQAVVKRKSAVPAQHAHPPQSIQGEECGRLLSARDCQLRGSCSLSRQLHLRLPRCLLAPTPPLSLAHLCFGPHKSL